jgi:branched-subunit amino acid permease
MVYFFAATAIILAVAILVIACLTTMTGWIIGSFAETVEQVKKRKNEE